MASFTYPIDFTGTAWLIHDGDWYVSSIGDDDTGDGSPDNPYQTIQKAIGASTSGQKLVIGTGTYIENVDGLGKDNEIEADGLVVMRGTQIGGTAFRNMGGGISNSLIGFQIDGFPIVLDGKIGRVENCQVLNGDIIEYKGVLLNCVIQNAQLNAIQVSKLRGCTLINVQNDFTIANTKWQSIIDCHFDKDTVFNVRQTNTTGTFDHCNQESGSIIRIDDTTDYFDAVTLSGATSYQVNGTSAAPEFNLPDFLDYTLKDTSPLLGAGSKGQAIGAFGLGASQNFTSIGNLTFTNVQLDLNDKFIIVPGFNTGQILTQIEDLGTKRFLGKVNLFAKQHFETPTSNAVVDVDNTDTLPNKITFEMRFGDTQTQLTDSSFLEFIWNKQPRVDVNNRGNGHPDFDLDNSFLVSAQFVQMRVTLRDETHMLTQETGCFIFQENGRGILLEP